MLRVGTSSWWQSLATKTWPKNASAQIEKLCWFALVARTSAACPDASTRSNVGRASHHWATPALIPQSGKTFANEGGKAACTASVAKKKHRPSRSKQRHRRRKTQPRRNSCYPKSKVRSFFAIRDARNLCIWISAN